MVVACVLGYKLYQDRQFSDLLFRHMTDAQTELNAFKNANSSVFVPELSASVEYNKPMSVQFIAEVSKQFDGPAVQKQLIKSGIAERMLQNVKLHNGSTLPAVTFGLNACVFWVEKVGQSISVVIEMPNPDPKKAQTLPRTQELFPVQNRESFGGFDEPPLTKEQFALIQKIVGS